MSMPIEPPLSRRAARQAERSTLDAQAERSTLDSQAELAADAGAAPVVSVEAVGSPSSHPTPIPLVAPIAPPATEGFVRRRDFRPPPVAVTEASAATDASAVTEASDAPPVAATMSRRELRARREQSEAAAEFTVAVEEASLPTDQPAPTIQPVLDDPAPTAPHWSVGIDEDDDPFGNTFSREVGATSSLTSTNALVLPQMPTASIAGPITGTGEIIITGLIDLPRVVSATGTVPAVHEHPDVDDLIDQSDLDVAPLDAAPVSASRAVSSHTQSHTTLTPPSSRLSSNTVTTALVAATVVMAVVAIGLFVVAAVNGLF